MGRRKALLIGINYVGTKDRLQGCHQDVRNMIPFLQSRGFSTDHHSMVVLADDKSGPYYPTGYNILAAMDWLVCEPNTSCFLHYSGHGGQVKDPSGDRVSGFNDTIVPVDYRRNGQIDSSTLHRHLVSRLAPGSQLHIIFDCCHSGSAVELPYVYRSDEHGNISLVDNLRQGMHLAETAGHLLQGGFTMDSVRDAQTLYAGASSFFGSLKHQQDPQKPGLGEEHFHHNWKSEHKRVVMFSGCRDDQTSSDASIQGSHLGAMSWAFLQTMHRSGDASYLEVLQGTRHILKQRYTQIPQLSVGNEMDLNQPMYL